MIDKLHPTGTSGEKAVGKINELIDVVNALICGDFEVINQPVIEFCRNVRDNIRDAQNKVRLEEKESEETSDETTKPLRLSGDK